MKKITKRMLSVILTIAMMMATSVPAFAVGEKEAITKLAYMDLQQASAEMREKILEAREKIIFSQSWVVDGVQGFVYDENGNVIEEVPHFSEIFPADWEVPVFDTNENVAQKSIDESQAIQALNDYTGMITVYKSTLKLRVPSGNTETPPFTSFNTLFKSGYFYFDITYVYTRGYDLDSSSSYKNYFNVGYTNADTGEALGWKTHIESWDVFGISTPPYTNIAVRASMYSDNADVKSGNWEIGIYAYCNYH